MKIIKFLTIFLTIHFLNTSIITTFLQTSSIDDQNLSKSICKITNGITSSKSESQDILIANLGDKIWSSTINDIVQCINEENAVIVTDLKTRLSEKSLRKAAVMILAFDEFDEMSIERIIHKHLDSTVFNHMSKIICMVPISSTISQRARFLKVFLELGYLNVAMVYKASPAYVFYEILKPFEEILRILKNPVDSSLVFPDKLKDLNGLHYQVPYFYQPPVVEIKDGYISAPMFFFLEAVGIAQNAEIDLIYLQNSSHMIMYWLSRSMHLTMNSGASIKFSYPKLQTYDKKSYCALVPIPPKTSMFYIIFVKPFDSLAWMFFALSIIISVVVWRMFRGRGAVDSHWQFAFGIFKMFIGHGADFSRRNRFVLAFLLNIICFTTFWFSNLYESAITSLMIEPAYDNRLQTVDDLLNSNFRINANPLFVYTLENSSLVQAMSPRLNKLSLNILEEDENLLIEHRYVFIRTCDVAKMSLKHKLSNDRFVSDYYYVLSEELSWQFIMLEASFLNPFLERFQHYMDLSFQAGLPQMWKVMASQDYSQFLNTQVKNEKIFLELEDIQSVFGLWLIGVCLSAFVLLLEIFYHDCLQNFKTVWNRIRNMFRSKKKVENPKVRKIFVVELNQNE